MRVASFSRLSARIAELPCASPLAYRPSDPAQDSLADPAREQPAVSTRKLIIAALVTGLAILVAFAIQVSMLAR